jgi:hypothetical protein
MATRIGLLDQGTYDYSNIPDAYLFGLSGWYSKRKLMEIYYQWHLWLTKEYLQVFVELPMELHHVLASFRTHST